MLETFSKFRPHANKIKEAGGHLYIVGGAVRDFVMGKEPHDIDFCVTGMTLIRFKSIFPNARLQGKQFPVFDVDGAEVAFARTEKKVGFGYKGFEIVANPDVAIEDDLRRRDLTINSIALDILTGELVDPYNGVRDVLRGVVTPTSEAFKEDPVRVMRAARIIAETGFKPTSDLYWMMREVKPELKTISDDMKLKEIRKVYASSSPWVFFNALAAAELLDDLFPELDAMIGVPQAHHDDGDAYDHSMITLRKARQFTDDPIILNSVTYHDVGKAETPKEILPAHHDHETRSEEIINRVTWMPKKWRKAAAFFGKNHMRGHRFSEMRRGKRVTFLEDLMRSDMGVEGFCTALMADKHTEKSVQNILNIRTSYAKIAQVNGHMIPESVPRDENFGDVLHMKRIEVLGKRM